MGVFTFFSYSSEVTTVHSEQTPSDAVHVSDNAVSESLPASSDESSEPARLPTVASVPIPIIVVSKASTEPIPDSAKPSRSSPSQAALSAAHEHAKKEKASSSFFKRFTRISSSEKRAKKSALVVRSLIIGPTSSNPVSRSALATPKLTLTSANARPKLNKLKTQLLQPKSANKLIAQLRALPIEDDHDSAAPRGPIHAVCLEHPDADEEVLHFSALTTTTATNPQNKSDEKHTGDTSFFDAPLSLDAVTDMLSKMNVISLVGSSGPSLGLGEPGDGEGILAGAVPTAETVLKGFEQITPQLMALGYATGKSVWVDHKGVYPPTDRMTILTYWWGLEIVLPPPSLKNLAQAKSIAGTVVNFLTALSLINNGVREILPFVRYIAQFIDFEFNTIQSQDRGMGVVCASTWIMPAALVPRPWDFPPPPSPPISISPPAKSDPTAPSTETPDPSVPLPIDPFTPVPSDKPHPQHPVSPVEQSPVTMPAIPLPLPSVADSIVGAYADSVTFQPVVVAPTPAPTPKTIKIGTTESVKEGDDQVSGQKGIEAVN